MQPSKYSLIQAMTLVTLCVLNSIRAATSLSTSSSFTRRQTLRFTRRSISKARPYRRTTPTLMPEGPEVKTLVDQLQLGVGQRLVNLQFVSGRYTKNGNKPTGFEEFRKTMTSYAQDDTTNVDVVQDWNCKGKFIWLTLDQGKTNDDVEITDKDYYRSMWITLGMTGRFVKEAFVAEEEDDGTTHNQARWYFEFLEEGPHNPEKRTRKIYYYDSRNFGTLRFSTSKQELMEKLHSLGPDILNGCTQEMFMDVLRRQRQTMNVCKFLMDQSKIAGTWWCATLS